VEGWIPIDHSPAGGFGHLSNNHLPLAKTGAMKFKFDGDKGTKDCGFIQPGYWFFWFGGGGEGGAIDTEFAVESFPYTDMPKMASKTEIQNAFSEAKQKMARKDYGRALQIYLALMVSDGCEEKDKGLLKCELARCYLKRNQRVKAAMELLSIIENDSNSILASRAIDLLKVIRREEVNLSSLNIERIRQGWGGPQRDKSVEGKEISIGGQKFKNGVGTHAESVCVIQTNGSVEKFSSLVGVDDETGNRGSVEFWVIGDGEVLWKSGVMKGGEKAKPVKVPVGGVKELILKVTGTEDGGVCDHADWADAKLLINGFYPAIIVPQN
jgi:hypothetical protein